MLSSQAETLAGGDIQLLAPGGSIVLGVTQGTRTNPQGGGIQAKRAGSIFTMSLGDVQVNQAAVHTLDGGDIVMWSTNGNIDAGKGAKTRRQIALPAFRTDETGTTTFDPGDVSTGAGIGTLQGVTGAPPGNITLATPNGFVDAGDAGIRSSGNLVIAAVAVLNASNIQVAGRTTGVPTVQAPNIGGLTAANNVAGSAAKTVAPTDSAPKEKPSVIIVEVLGYGGGDGDEPAGEEQRRPKTDDKRS